jgi:hypothetical protein
MSLIELNNMYVRIQKLKTAAKQLDNEVLMEIIREIRKCTFYHWDDGAFEEYCRHPTKIPRMIPYDFDSKRDCWDCKVRKVN